MSKSVHQLLIKKYPLESVAIAKLEHDKSNPNVMTDTLFDSLCYSLEKYGALEPIKICPIKGQKDKFLIIDGHHRVKAYEHHRIPEIDAYIIDDLNEIEIKLARQAFNKIHGEHVPEKDIKELELILNHNAKDLQLLIAVDADTLKKMQELLSQPGKEDWAKNLEAVSNLDALEKSHQVTLIFSPKDFALFNKTVESVPKGSTTTEKVMNILKEYNKSGIQKKKTISRII